MCVNCVTAESLSYTGGKCTDMMREMGLYAREMASYSKVIKHFQHILSQRGSKVQNTSSQ